MILVIGSFMTDCVTTCNHAPKAGETVIGISYDNFLGGKGANQAVAARRLGSEVVMAGKIGLDSFGDKFIDEFTNEGINVDNVLRTNKHTGIGSITLDKTGENRIVVIPGANLEYNINELYGIENVIIKANIVVAQLEMQMEVIEEIGKLCKKHNKTFILNPAPANNLSDELLSSVTYLTPNESELSLLTGTNISSFNSVVEGAKILLDKGVKNVIVTLGAKGAMLVNNETSVVVEGYKVDVVDTVAAGDSFNGALAYSLENNYDIISSLSFANAVGALAVQKLGAIPSLPKIEEVNNFIEKFNNKKI